MVPGEGWAPKPFDVLYDPGRGGKYMQKPSSNGCAASTFDNAPLLGIPMPRGLGTLVPAPDDEGLAVTMGPLAMSS